MAVESAHPNDPGAPATTNIPMDSVVDKPDDATRTASPITSGKVSPDVEAQKQAAAPMDESHYERPRYKIVLIMLSLMLAVFLAALDITIVTTALPTISEYFHTSDGYTWIGSGYLLANAASTPIWGKISDIFGRKPSLLLANALFFIGSLIAALSINIGMLITARAIQGIGGGGLVSLSNVCIGDLFSPRRRGAYYGIIGGVWAIASSLGPILGGVFTEKVSWRWCFYINLPLDAIAFVILLLFLDVKTPKTALIPGLKAIDWLGSFLVVGGTLMFLFGLEYGGVTFPWSSATVVSLLVIGVFTFCLFILVEVKIAKYPIMPARIFRNTSNVASLAACFLQSFVFIAGSYYLPLYFQASLGATPILSGVYVLATAVALSISSIATGIFIRKTGKYKPPILIGFVLQTIGYGLFINLDANSSWAKIIIFQLIAGLGIGPNFQAPLIALQSGISPKDIASATALFGFTRNLATAISVVIGGVIFQNEVTKKISSDPALSVLAASSGGGGPGASIGVVNSLQGSVKAAAQEAFATSLQPGWILYTVISALGIVNFFFIGTNVLSKQHEETKTGLEAEKERRDEMDKENAERHEKRKSRRSGKVLQDGEEKRHDRRSWRHSGGAKKSMDVEKSANSAVAGDAISGPS